MAATENTQQSSNLVTLEPQTWLKISILVLVFYVEHNVYAKMACTENTQQSSNLVTLAPQTWLKISILVLVFYVEHNAGRSIDDLVADNLRVNEGDSAVLPCFFSPTNAIIGKWYWKTNRTVIIRSDDPPDLNSRYLLGDATSGGNASLVIKEVLRWDKGTYTCGVNDQSTGSTVPYSDDSKLTVNYLDNPKIQALTDTRIPEGTRVSMSCKVVSSYPEVSLLTWFHEGDIIDSASGKYVFSVGILEIKKFDQRDEGNYSCRAENEYFFGKNGKYSNSIAFSLKKKEAIPPLPSSSQIWIVFIIIPVLIIGVVVLAMYFLKRRSKNIHRFDDFVIKKVIKLDQRKEINVERALDDLIPQFLEKGYDEHLNFNHRVLKVARGECSKTYFISTYEPEHFCFKKIEGYHDPFFTMLLLSRKWPEKRLRLLYSSDKKNTRRTEKFKDNGSRESIEFSLELKKHVKYGATGYLMFNDVTDDDEGHYIYLLQIKKELQLSGEPPKIGHAFYGRTSIQLTNAIYRSNFDKKQFISPIAIVISDHQVYAFALKTEKGERKEGQEDDTILRYITCAGKLQSENSNITITWSEVDNVLLKPEEDLLSFVALPGKYHPYIFLGYINVSKDRRVLGKVFSFLPNGSFKLINNIVKTLESEGPVEILRFDPLSGKKLSNGRLVVGGWIQHGYQKRKRMDVLKSRFTGSTFSRGKLEDVENQSYEYEPFIMWTDDEINWNLGEHFKIDEAEENMRIQVTEIGNGKGVVLIISSLDSKKVLYEGQSNDYCTTFTEKTKDCQFQMPVVSFAIINGSFVCASSMKYVEETSGQQGAVSSAKEGGGSSKNAMKEDSPEQNEPANDGTGTSTLEKPYEDSVEVSIKNVEKQSVFGKAASMVTNALSYNSRESSANKSTQKYENVSTNELSSVNNDKSVENVIKEGSPETNELIDNEKVSASQKPPEDSMEGTSLKVKKRSSLGKFGRGLADRFSFSSKKASSANEQAKECESVSLTEESTFNKEELTENTIKEGSPPTNNLTDDEQVMPTVEDPTEDSMEGSSDNVKKLSLLGRFSKAATNKLPTKSKRETSGSKSTKESETSEIEVTYNVEGSSSQIQDRSAWEGLWHLEQDTTDDKVIRLKPVKHDTGSSDTPNGFVTILENRSKVQCEQIVPFTCKGKSWFFMIYTTHYIKVEEQQSRSLCTRYHVFSLDTLMGGN